MTTVLLSLAIIAPLAGLTWWAAHNTNKELESK